MAWVLEILSQIAMRRGLAALDAGTEKRIPSPDDEDATVSVEDSAARNESIMRQYPVFESRDRLVVLNPISWRRTGHTSFSSIGFS
jgi:hypothetical protein